MNAQGGLKTLPEPNYRHTEYAQTAGKLVSIDNRQLSRLAKLAGAPLDMTAGVRLHVSVGSIVSADTPLFTLLSDSAGERDYALEFYHQQSSIFSIEHSGEEASHE